MSLHVADRDLRDLGGRTLRELDPVKGAENVRRSGALPRGRRRSRRGRGGRAVIRVTLRALYRRRSERRGVELTAGATSPERSEVFDFELFIVVARSGAGVGVALGRVRIFAREEFKAIESAFGFGVG